MKKILFFALLAVLFAGLPFLHAEDSAYDQLNEAAGDTAAFDGGEGSSINTSSSGSGSVPDVGPSGPVGYYDENMNYHSN